MADAALRRDVVMDEIQQCERKAWDGLARHQYWIFGFYAARAAATAMLWRRGTEELSPNPFQELVEVAKRKFCVACKAMKAPGQAHRCGTMG